MKKQEVLSLLERFPDLVDSDELIQDLYREAVEAPASIASDSEKARRCERNPTPLHGTADGERSIF
jgi:hypothetical protein